MPVVNLVCGYLYIAYILKLSESCLKRISKCLKVNRIEFYISFSILTETDALVLQVTLQTSRFDSVGYEVAVRSCTEGN